MRVRKETGDFSIKLDTNNAATIRPKLSAEDLLGYVVDNGTNLTVITSVADSTSTITLTAGSVSYTYTKSTGAVAKNV